MIKILRIRLMIIAFVTAIALGSALFTQRVHIKETLQGLDQPDLPEAVSFEELNKVSDHENDQFIEGNEEDFLQVSEIPKTSETLPPASINLAVPFTPQAPQANWDLPYQEACEEASMYMVYSFYNGLKAGLIPAEVADSEILKITDFENEFIGNFLDTTAQQTADVIEGFYGFSQVDLIYDPTIKDIKSHIAAGRPVIVPAAGQNLGNPFFTPPGPLYHMLVIRGYTETGFITNDPGTYRGEEFFYEYNQLMSAIGDWNDGYPENGQKVVIVIYPEE